MKKHGFDFSTVAAQDEPDGRFPTVPSPNPENASALQIAIDQAESTGADLISGTDPDCDRIGAGVADENGKIQLLTGNQIGSLLPHGLLPVQDLQRPRHRQRHQPPTRPSWRRNRGQ